MDLRYILYTRRSTDDEKQALSIESQREELERRFGDLKIVQVIEENGSAFQPNNRPKFEKMLQDIEAGKADGIVTWHPDRLSRNVIDGAHVLHALDRGVLKDLKFGSYHFHNSPEGKMMLGFALSQSKYFSEKLGVDVMRGMEKKCRLGHMPVH
jgi:site-specific DNA recombinase